MKKYFKPLAWIFSIIAIVMMVIGIILGLTGKPLISVSGYTWYFAAANFILFAILFYLAGTPYKTE
ncbi:MAG: hypothetical protein PHD25_05370 [Bacteroidales bacterium]|nr:hypothetical protein [Bacteroidales bacterium]